jgi:hypothetical protein
VRNLIVVAAMCAAFLLSGSTVGAGPVRAARAHAGPWYPMPASVRKVPCPPGAVEPCTARAIGGEPNSADIYDAAGRLTGGMSGEG